MVGVVRFEEERSIKCSDWLCWVLMLEVVRFEEERSMKCSDWLCWVLRMKDGS